MRLKNLDYLNAGSAIAAVVGLITAYIGCAVLSVQEDIGVNLALSPVVYVGSGLVLASLVGAIVGNVLYEKKDLNRRIATAAIYLAVIAVMVLIVLIAYIVLNPVLNPSNG